MKTQVIQSGGLCVQPTEMQSERLQLPRLLVFTLGEAHESRRRRLLPAAFRPIERRLHRACLEQAFAAGRGAGFALEVSSPSTLRLPDDVTARRQCRGSFGRRITTAFHRASSHGSEPLVLVGSDVPGLTADHLKRTHQALIDDPNQVVIGPSPDGGFYLLAAARPLGNALDGVRWRSRETLSSLRQALARIGRPVVLLSPLADLDRRADLEQWLAQNNPGVLESSLLWRDLGRRLLEIFSWLRRSTRVGNAPRAFQRSPRRLPVRGPPALLPAV